VKSRVGDRHCGEGSGKDRGHGREKRLAGSHHPELVGVESEKLRTFFFGGLAQLALTLARENQLTHVFAGPLPWVLG